MLQSIQRDIETYKEEHKVLPSTLADIPHRQGRWSHPHGPLADEWGHPFQYQVTGSSYDLYSYGRDGQPGGVGFDAELYHDGRNAEQTLPTFAQYFGETDEEEVDRGRFTGAGFIAGGMVFFIAFSSLKEFDTADQPFRPAFFLVYGLVIILIASLMGAVLLPLHIPSGH